MTTQGSIGRRTHPDVMQKIDDILAVAPKNWTGERLQTRLKTEFSNRSKVRIPTVRTLQRILKSKTIEDDTAQWNIDDYSAEDSRLILEILPQIAILTYGATVTLTIKEANSVLKVRRVAPDLGIYGVWRVSYLYRLYEQTGKPTTTLDMFLALAPWQEDESWRKTTYENMTKLGWLEKHDWDYVLGISSHSGGVKFGSKFVEGFNHPETQKTFADLNKYVEE